MPSPPSIRRRRAPSAAARDPRLEIRTGLGDARSRGRSPCRGAAGRPGRRPSRPCRRPPSGFATTTTGAAWLSPRGEARRERRPCARRQRDRRPTRRVGVAVQPCWSSALPGVEGLLGQRHLLLISGPVDRSRGEPGGHHQGAQRRRDLALHGRDQIGLRGVEPLSRITSRDAVPVKALAALSDWSASAVMSSAVAPGSSPFASASSAVPTLVAICGVPPPWSWPTVPSCASSSPRQAAAPAAAGPAAVRQVLARCAPCAGRSSARPRPRHDEEPAAGRRPWPGPSRRWANGGWDRDRRAPRRPWPRPASSVLPLPLIVIYVASARERGSGR